MEYPRVNLLKKNELRFQGAVSRRFIFSIVLAVPLLLIAVLGGLQLVQRSWLNSNLKTSQEIWDDLQPRLAFVKQEKQALKSNQELLNLLEGWTDSQLNSVDLLNSIQELVPENIQLSKVLIRTQSDSTVFRKKADLQPRHSLMIEGLSHGMMAENAVIQLRKDLLKSDCIGRTFSSINLASLRKRQGVGGEVIREFQLVGQDLEGSVQ